MSAFPYWCSPLVRKKSARRWDHGSETICRHGETQSDSLLPRADSTNIFHDRDLLILSRAVVLAERWKAQGQEYRKLLMKYERDLRDILTKRFRPLRHPQVLELPRASEVHLPCRASQGRGHENTRSCRRTYPPPISSSLRNSTQSCSPRPITTSLSASFCGSCRSRVHQEKPVFHGLGKRR